MLEQLAAEHKLNEKMEKIGVILRDAIGAKPMVLPALEGTASTLDLFPGVLLNTQVAQLIQYGCTPANNYDDVDLVNEENYYLLIHSNAGGMFTAPDRVAPLNKKECTISDNDNLSREVDHGILSQLADVIKAHKTILKQCLCQYPRLWGLPCCHMLRVMCHLSGNVLVDADS